MKTLYLLRHAKAIKDFVTPDLQRGLTDRGKEDLLLMSQRLRELKAMPELIISSHAKRARKTAELLAAGIAYHEVPQQDPRLYETNPMDLLYFVHELPETNKSVMLVGHNPCWTSSVMFLTDTELDHLPTSGIARIDFNIKSWKMIEEAQGKLVFLEYPRLIKEKRQQ